MRYLLILTLSVACAQGEVKKQEAPRAHTGEYSQKVDESTGTNTKSPYTVKPCYCMKIFRPVCADGKPFGNSCEAECQGHQIWTEGPCPKMK